MSACVHCRADGQEDTLHSMLLSPQGLVLACAVQYGQRSGTVQNWVQKLKIAKPKGSARVCVVDCTSKCPLRGGEISSSVRAESWPENHWRSSVRGLALPQLRASRLAPPSLRWRRAQPFRNTGATRRMATWCMAMAMAMAMAKPV